METLTDEEAELIRVALDWFFVCDRASVPDCVASWIFRETGIQITAEQVKAYIRLNNFRVGRL